MADIRFYHVTTQALHQAIPAILSKAYAQGKKMVLRVGDEDTLARYDDLLWSQKPESFLPHGTGKDPRKEQQPIYLTLDEENPAKADMLALYNIDTVPANISDFSLVCDFISGQNPESVEAGRARWKAYKAAGHNVTYWQQTDSGGWEQKA